MFAIIVILSPVIAVAIPPGVWERFSTIFEDYDVQNMDPTSGLRMAAGSQKERLQLIIKAVSLTFEHPIFGVGMGDFSSASAHQWSTGSGRDWVQTHNTYLQFSSELGLPGLVLYIILLVTTFKTLRRAREQIPEGGPGTKPYMLRLICDATNDQPHRLFADECVRQRRLPVLFLRRRRHWTSVFLRSAESNR